MLWMYLMSWHKLIVCSQRKYSSIFYSMVFWLKKYIFCLEMDQSQPLGTDPPNFIQYQLIYFKGIKMHQQWCPRPHLQCLEGVWKRLHPDKEGGYYDGRGVVGTVVALCRQIFYGVKVCWMKSTVNSKRKKEWKVRSWNHTFPFNVPNFFISLDEHLSPFLCLSSHWLREVTESCGIWKIERLSRIEINQTCNTFITPPPPIQ